MITVSFLLMLLLLHLIDHFVVTIHSSSLGRWRHHQILLSLSAYLVVVAHLREYVIVLFNQISVLEKAKHRQYFSEAQVNNYHDCSYQHKGGSYSLRHTHWADKILPKQLSRNFNGRIDESVSFSFSWRISLSRRRYEDINDDCTKKSDIGSKVINQIPFA